MNLKKPRITNGKLPSSPLSAMFLVFDPCLARFVVVMLVLLVLTFMAIIIV